MADQRVREVQQWLNDTFPTYFKYSEHESEKGTFPIEPDGITGNRTMKALVMAVQIHFNLVPVDGVWGNGTSAACPTINSDITDQIILKIAQGGFYCKGYEPGGFDGIWGNGLANCISEFKEDLGISGTASMNADVFKALLTTDPTVLVASGKAKIRSVQKFLNQNYYNLYKSKLGYIPTGGIFERKTSKALIYAFQKEIGTTPDGALGPNTFNSMPTISEGSDKNNLVKILQACLICNDYEMDFNGIYDQLLTAKVTAFQRFMCLHLDSSVVLGNVNRRTWGALLWSKGDTERTPNACDCRTPITEESTANALYDRGFRYIGRYLTNVEPNGYNKKLTIEEISILLNAGLKIFPIFQESVTTPAPTDFNEMRGATDALRAFNAAFRLGLKKGNTIYFAIDCDVTDENISDYVIPYFRGILSKFNSTKQYYKIGVYGARNTCRRLLENNLVVNCFVSNMSTGYSGNLGYTMPEQWAFEQYIEKKSYSAGDMTFDLDYDMASGVDEGVDTVDFMPEEYIYEPPYIPSSMEMGQMKPIVDLIPAIRWLEEQYYLFYEITTPTSEQRQNCQKAVCDYLYQYMYEDYPWPFISPKDELYVMYINNLEPNEYTELLHPYIFAETIGEGNDKITIHAKFVTDNLRGVFELPHLAVVIKCYLYSNAPEAWSSWAGDFATLVKEIYVNKQSVSNEYFDFAVERLGATEPERANVNEARMFNYYDLIADIDGYKIEQLMINTDSFYALSECLGTYYNTISMYGKRYQYAKGMIGFDDWNLFSIRNEILKYYEDALILRRMFSWDVGNYPGSSEAAALALSENILYWANVENVSMS